MVQYDRDVDRAFAALADPTRRAVVERLGSGRATVSELAGPFGMSLTGMRKHIRLLEEAELVTTEKVGRVRMCTLTPYAFEGISSWLQRLDRFAQIASNAGKEIPDEQHQRHNPQRAGDTRRADLRCATGPRLLRLD